MLGTGHRRRKVAVGAGKLLKGRIMRSIGSLESTPYNVFTGWKRIRLPNCYIDDKKTFDCSQFESSKSERSTNFEKKKKNSPEEQRRMNESINDVVDFDSQIIQNICCTRITK